VRIPVEFELPEGRVLIHRQSRKLIIEPAPWATGSVACRIEQVGLTQIFTSVVDKNQINILIQHLAAIYLCM